MKILYTVTLFLALHGAYANSDTASNQFRQKIVVDTLTIKTINDHKEDTNYPAILTGIVGAISVLVNLGIGLLTTHLAAKNIDKQLASSKKIADLQFNSQVLVNMEKEWANNVKNNLATVLYQAKFIWQTVENVNNDNSEKYDEAKREMVSSQSRLTLLLDKKNPMEDTLLKEVASVVKMAKSVTDEFNEDQFSQGIDNTIASAHLLFNFRIDRLVNS